MNGRIALLVAGCFVIAGLVGYGLRVWRIARIEAQQRRRFEAWSDR